MEVNPRYALYARAHGCTPERMLEMDKATWPGGCMAGFILWMSARKEEFRRQHPEAMMDKDSIVDHAAWDAFLERRANL